MVFRGEWKLLDLESEHLTLSYSFVPWFSTQYSSFSVLDYGFIQYKIGMITFVSVYHIILWGRLNNIIKCYTGIYCCGTGVTVHTPTLN